MASEGDFASLLRKFQAPDNMNNVSPKRYSASNDTPRMNLRCPECGVTKWSTEDLEIHLKIEHLDWIPFQCPVCSAQRASDALMREHVYTNHKNSVQMFNYVDNQEAKKKLQILIDRAIQYEIQKKTAPRQNVGGKICKRDEMESPPAEPYPSNSESDSVKEEPEDVSDESSMDALLASITRAANGENEGSPLEMESPKGSEAAGDEGGSEDPLDNLVGASFDLSNLVALFTSGSDASTAASSSNDEKKRLTPKPESGLKKRLAGTCTQCNKTVTAGARQMHIFYHLAKDFQVFRFRCLFDGCSAEHYRKDQMENHQSKAHGAVDLGKMEDRAQELFPRTQELSIQLLGSKNTVTPLTEGKNKGGKASGRSTPHRVVSDEENTLECRLCQKNMQNKLRGFHVLWHLGKDLGITRYVCKICGFAHERSQSIVTHGKKEHGDDSVLLDKIKDYKEEVNEMTDKCFGLKPTTAQEKKRKNEEAPVMPELSPYSPVAKKKKVSNDSMGHSDEDRSRECTPGEDYAVDDEHEGIEDEEEV